MFTPTDYQKNWLDSAAEMAASPAMHLKPRIYPDGNMWCALYGENLQEGVCGFGNTPEGAMADFDRNFRTQTLNIANIGIDNSDTTEGENRK